MRLNISRAHKRFLGLTGEEMPRQEEELVSVGRVEVTPPAVTFLQEQLQATGRHRGGALLGYRWKGVIVVLHATSSGYSGWYEQDDNPLHLDGRYLLGWVDGLRKHLEASTPVDWVGNWISYPDSLLGTRLEEDLEWINEASRTRLVDDEHCLLIVGLEDGELASRAYTVRLPEGSPITLYHNLAGPQPRLPET